MDDKIKKILSYTNYRQSIKLSPRYSTPGTVDKTLWEYIGLPESLKSKTFLDVGTNDGLLAFEAENRGALHVTASDIYIGETENMQNGWSKEGIDLLVDYFKSKIEIHTKGVYYLTELKSEYDIVVVSHIINWLEDIDEAIKQLAAVTSGSLYISDGFLKKNNLPKKEVPKGMPMRYMYNILFITNLLKINGFKKVEVTPLNAQKLFLNNYLKFPRIYVKNNTKIYSYPSLDASMVKTTDKDVTETVNHQLDNFYHVFGIGWLHENDVVISYQNPSLLFKVCNTIRLKSIYLKFLNFKHSQANNYTYFMIKADK